MGVWGLKIIAYFCRRVITTKQSTFGFMGIEVCTYPKRRFFCGEAQKQVRSRGTRDLYYLRG